MENLLPPAPTLKGWTVRHRLPGRVRIYGPALRGDSALGCGISRALQRLPGVSYSSASAASGTVLVQFDPSLQSVESLLEALGRVHRARSRQERCLEDREVAVLETMRTTLAALDRRIRLATAGKIGLRQIALGLMTVRSVTGIGAAGPSPEAIEPVVDLLLTWILFRHPRLERELERVEVYVQPGL